MSTIRVGADKPALLADRLVRRLERDRLLDDLGPERQSARSRRTRIEQITEALADEIHQDVLDATLRKP